MEDDAAWLHNNHVQLVPTMGIPNRTLAFVHKVATVEAVVTPERTPASPSHHLLFLRTWPWARATPSPTLIIFPTWPIFHLQLRPTQIKLIWLLNYSDLNTPICPSIQNCISLWVYGPYGYGCIMHPYRDRIQVIRCQPLPLYISQLSSKSTLINCELHLTKQKLLV